MSATRGFDGVNIANEVSNGHVGRCQLLNVAIIGRQVCDRRIVAFAGNQLTAALADRFVRVIANLAAGNVPAAADPAMWLKRAGYGSWPVRAGRAE